MSEVLGNLLSLIIIVSLIVIVYCKATNKTIGELIEDIKGSTVDKAEEVVQ